MPMIKALIENAEKYREVLRKRNASQEIFENFEKGIGLYKQQREFKQKIQALCTERNKLSKEYGKTKDGSLLKKAEEVKAQIEALERSASEIDAKLQQIELTLPNWLADDVPEGTEADARAIEYVGIPRVNEKFANEFEKKYPGAKYATSSENFLHHYDLVGKLIDQETAAKIAGSRFYCELDELVLLDFALTMYALEFFRKKGYAKKLMVTPYLMKKNIEEKITYFTSFADTIFELEKEGLILIPSSEHTIVAYYADTIFEEKELPLRIMAWSPCFRKEAGAHGKDTKGIFRTKQFHKLEIHTIAKKDEDFAEIERLRCDIQQFMFSLGLPNRSVVLASADTDMRALKQIDIETWMPAQNAYRETHSIATMGTWVSEKVKMRYTTRHHERFPTTNIYATAIATQRTICAIVENHYVAKENKILVPKVLQRYAFGLEEIKL